MAELYQYVRFINEEGQTYARTFNLITEPENTAGPSIDPCRAAVILWVYTAQTRFVSFLFVTPRK